MWFYFCCFLFSTLGMNALVFLKTVFPSSAAFHGSFIMSPFLPSVPLSVFYPLAPYWSHDQCDLGPCPGTQVAHELSENSSKAFITFQRARPLRTSFLVCGGGPPTWYSCLQGPLRAEEGRGTLRIVTPFSSFWRSLPHLLDGLKYLKRKEKKIASLNTCIVSLCFNQAQSLSSFPAFCSTWPSNKQAHTFQ